MKFTLVDVILATLLVLATVPVKASSLDDRISELKHAIEKEATAKAGQVANGPNGFVNPRMNPAFLNATIDQMVSQMENPAYGGNMEAQLAQITSVYTSDEVQEATTNLINEIHKEHKDKADAEIADLKALIARAGQNVNQAKKPEDLDDLIATMGLHGNNRYGGNPALSGDQQLNQQFTSAFEFAKLWQNYLSHLATGQPDLARNDLQMLSQNDGGSGLVPRSKLLALAAPDKLKSPSGTAEASPATAAATADAEAQAILDGMKTLDDIKPALDKLEPLKQRDMAGILSVCQSLSQMLESYQSLRAGLPTPVNFFPNINNGLTIPVNIRSQFYLISLQSSFGSFKGPPPAPTEKPMEFVSRVIADAIGREDWQLLHSAVEARDNLNQGVNFPAGRPNAIDSVISGAHQEAAGQFALAVQSYEAALKSTDSAVPVKAIGDKLAAIQREHPKEFADGMQLTVAPPAPNVYQRPPQRTPYNPAAAPIPSSLLSPAAATNAPSAPPK